MPIGIEIEVPWKAYFPDLWKPGFPNLCDAEMWLIWQECTEHERILLPRLQKTVECGVPKGADRYWEFAFDPVTDPSIVCNQYSILQANGLLPKGRHSLHITLGGLRVTRDTVFLALLLECMASSRERIMTGFHDEVISKGWARKGFAGVFEKEGDHDIQHGYQYAAEIRILHVPDTVEDLYRLLYKAQKYAFAVQQTQAGKSVMWWNKLVFRLGAILEYHKLPNRNWRKPHLEPEVWNSFADQYDSISRLVNALADGPGRLFL